MSDINDESLASKTPKSISQAKLNRDVFIKRLTESMTQFDAHLILDSALSTVGMQKHEGTFKKEDAKTLCLALIKKGGPAYRVGAGIYREYVS